MTEAMEQQLKDFFIESQAHRKALDDAIKEIKLQIVQIQLTLAEERGKDVPGRLVELERRVGLFEQFKDSVAGSLVVIRWLGGVIATLLVGLIVMVAREMMTR